MMNIWRTRIKMSLVVLSCLGVAAVWAQSKPVQDKQKAEAAAKAAPSGGGSPFTSDCGNDGVMVGLWVNTGTLVDSVQAVCAKVDGIGGWAGSPYSGARAGGNGGGPARLMCDAGWAVTAVFGKSGSLVDSIGVRCGKMGVDGGKVKIVSGSASRGPVGGSGGSSAFDRPCSGGQTAQGISGRAGTLIDQISSVACNNPAHQPARSAACASGFVLQVDKGGEQDQCYQKQVPAVAVSCGVMRPPDRGERPGQEPPDVVIAIEVDRPPPGARDPNTDGCAARPGQTQPRQAAYCPQGFDKIIQAGPDECGHIKPPTCTGGGSIHVKAGPDVCI